MLQDAGFQLMKDTENIKQSAHNKPDDWMTVAKYTSYAVNSILKVIQINEKGKYLNRKSNQTSSITFLEQNISTLQLYTVFI